MTSYVPRKSREAHVERLLRAINDDGPVEFAEGGRVDVTRVPAGTFDTMPFAEPSSEGRAAIWRVLARRAAVESGAADCVCEEPCRYCRCEDQT